MDDVLALDAATIEERGFVLIGVGNGHDFDHDFCPWAYTVGLLDAAAHPELIVAGPKHETSQLLLSMLAQSILDGERYEVGDTLELGRGVTRIGAVHENQYQLETFNMWHNLRAYGAVDAPELEAVQIVVPSGFFCTEHRHSQPLLASPGAHVGPRSLNRAERRRRHRRAS